MDAPERPPHLAGRLKEPFDEHEVNAIWRVLERRRDRRPALRLGGWVSLSFGIALLLLSWGVWRGHRSDEPLALEDRRALPEQLESPQAHAAFRLSDGSAVELSRGSLLEVLRNDGDEMSTVLRRGKSTFDVKPGGRRRWTIEVGYVRVQVVGTRFVVDRQADAVEVRVQRGVVLVRSESLVDGVRRLTAGQSLRVEAPPTRVDNTQMEPIPAAAVSPSPAPAPAPMEPPASVAPPRAVHAEPARNEARWDELAAHGEYHAALVALEQHGGLAFVARTTNEPALLLSLSDVAREVDQPAQAVLVLERLLASHPDSREAPMAAFTLGKIQLERLGRPLEAVAAFERVLAHERGAVLAEHALARLADAYEQAGRHEDAERSARLYLERHPAGRHRARAEAILERAP